MTITENKIGQEYFPGNLKEVLEYAEGYKGNHPSITSLPRKKYSVEDKQMLLTYLSLPTHYRLSLTNIVSDIDVFTDESLHHSARDRSTWLNHDGTWKWARTLYYYIDNYDIAVPEEFLEHVRKRLG